MGRVQLERTELLERREGKLRRTLGDPLPGKSVEELDLIGEADVLRAEQGLVAILVEDGTISHKPLADLLRRDMHSRTGAQGVQVGWLKERVERRRKGQDSPSISTHLG